MAEVASGADLRALSSKAQRHSAYSAKLQLQSSTAFAASHLRSCSAAGQRSGEWVGGREGQRAGGGPSAGHARRGGVLVGLWRAHLHAACFLAPPLSNGSSAALSLSTSVRRRQPQLLQQSSKGEKPSGADLPGAVQPAAARAAKGGARRLLHFIARMSGLAMAAASGGGPRAPVPASVWRRQRAAGATRPPARKQPAERVPARSQRQSRPPCDAEMEMEAAPQTWK